ncbi:GNAT family N-acetyltransferase [Fictibacillus nanhaiensis]|jgi:GNAT superfamily N-acetyltransferase|uniref:GNAT family N-acetyltransferase n=1 Tax=Fictibacillus nanhaiensis TaxID=742169 RepID=UPI003C19D968
MEEFEIRNIDNLLNHDITRLLIQSKEEGFRFVERLVNDYKNGSNTFTNEGEALFGAFTQNSELIGICGLNKDPYSNQGKIGRLRRFYISKTYREKGVGRLLLNRVICEAKLHYRIIVLHTDTELADNFYTSNGFSKSNVHTNSTHYLDLKQKLFSS